jgi:AmpE protein
MSLISLLIALVAERTLSNKVWRFNYYYSHYQHLFSKNFTARQGVAGNIAFVLLPVFITYFLIEMVDNALLQMIISTLILIVCFGCTITRQSYKQYLHSAFRGEESNSDMHHQQLLSDKNLPQMGFGQALIWLNYRYYIAIMLYFIVFGAAGVVFYRLLTTVIEHKNSQCVEALNSDEQVSNIEQVHESNVAPDLAQGCQNHHDVLFWLDWLPVRITSFGYMFVGHFSKAMPVWLESLFETDKPTYQVLISVAEKSEDVMVNSDDCTSQPCLLVRLAKRNVLLMLAIIAVLTLTGFIS